MAFQKNPPTIFHFASDFLQHKNRTRKTVAIEYSFLKLNAFYQTGPIEFSRVNVPITAGIHQLLAA